MNRNPLILRRINKLIGQAMRQLQLSNGQRKAYLRWTICYLNLARVAYKRGEHQFIHGRLDCALANLRWACEA